jgi:squalene synthase HpnC
VVRSGRSAIGLEALAVRARSREENFPVALRLLGRAERRHLLAIYDFARATDELGDSAAGDRLALLDAWQHDLDGAAIHGGRHPITRNLAPTIRALALPLDPFHALIEANRRDQLITRYETFEQLVAYCRLSANPIGELVLRVFGALTPQRLQWSNDVCTALQLVEHWQDVREDYAAGRIYLPATDLTRFSVREEDFANEHASPALVDLLRFETRRAAAWLDSGAPLVRSLRGRARIAVAGFVGGGRAAIDSLERGNFDVLAETPKVRKSRLVWHGVSMWLRARPRGAAS